MKLTKTGILGWRLPLLLTQMIGPSRIREFPLRLWVSAPKHPSSFQFK